MNALHKIFEEMDRMIEMGLDGNHEKVRQLDKGYKNVVKDMKPEEVLLARLMYALDQYKVAVGGEG